MVPTIPPRAIHAFVTALGAVEASHHAQITLIGETTYLVKWLLLQERKNKVIYRL